jgi:methylmalonyl-CoA mutase cobalamin-binding domain/chain
MKDEGSEERLARITAAMVTLDTDALPGLVEEALEGGCAAPSIVAALSAGINEVGDRFEAMEYFLPELITAADAMDQAMAIVRPALAGEGAASAGGGTVVLAQVQGDIHDIGRNILAAMLRAAGFTVHDIGHDVRPDVVIDRALEVDADVIGLSSLLTTSLPFAAQVPRLLHERGLDGRFRVALGGGAVTPDYATRAGADGYAVDAAATVRLMHELVAAGR